MFKSNLVVSGRRVRGPSFSASFFSRFLAFRSWARRSVPVLVIFTVLFAPLAAAKDLNLTIVYDNNSYKEGLETRCGFSCFVEGPGKTIMFSRISPV
jgi:hypothetical protein